MHAPLRRPLLGRPLLQAVQDALLEERLDQAQHAPVRHLLAHQGHQAVMRDRVEVAFQIGIDDVRVARLEQLVHSTQRVFTSPSGAKAVAVLREVVLEDRFQ